MISRLRGVLLEKMPPQIVIDVNGVGYELDVSMQTFTLCLLWAKRCSFIRIWWCCEDAHLLFGFGDASERTTFRQLIKVSGIWCKNCVGHFVGDDG